MQELISDDPEYRVDFLHPRILFCHYILLIVFALSSCRATLTPRTLTSTPAQPTETVTAMATFTAQPSAEVAQLRPVGAVRAYPGPEHYAGDILTFEILVISDETQTAVPVTLRLDDQEPTEVSAELLFNSMILPLALDTSDLIGSHTVRITTTLGNSHINELYSFDVLPASERPAQEANAKWMVNEIDCCVLHYVSGTAAARDIGSIAENFQQAAQDFSAITGEKFDKHLEVYIIDRSWGNGGFGGDGQLVISYTDRYYGPTIGAECLETLARHEFTHAAGVGAFGDGIDFNYEGLAVYVAGGHYKPEPLAQRGAALFDLGYYVPVGQSLEQHELAYLYPAAMLTYIVETYGADALWKFFAADADTSDGQPATLEAAIQSTFGISLTEFDADFRTWLESGDPGEQLDDLRLTIELQDLRRTYQDTYAPPPYFFLGKAEDILARTEYLPVVLREAHAPPNIVIELIIANAQQAIIDSDYSKAEQLIDALKEVLSTQEFENLLAKEYLAIAITLTNEGYNLEALDLQDDQALVEVTRDSTELISLELHRNDAIWQILQ